MNVLRFRRLVSIASAGLAERDEIIACSLLTMLSGQSVFFFGPPGTAKSLIARRLAGLFQSSSFFECLLNRFTTPEELFGPVSIRELKEGDRYVRKTAGYLPTADFAFLDEIWKSSPGILNSLLTILNERKFRNGDAVDDVPLKAIVAASNEIPAEGQGLEALYDRFVMRLTVPPVSNPKSFESILRGAGAEETIQLPDPEKISNDEWRDVMARAKKVSVSAEALSVVHAVRGRIAGKTGEKKEAAATKPIYVSDRRWIKAMAVARTAAAICGRDEVLPIDILVLADCLWSHAEDRDAIRVAVETSVREIGGGAGGDVSDWLERFKALENEFLGGAAETPSDSPYETKDVNGVASICVPPSNATMNVPVYIPNNWSDLDWNFHPLDKDGYSCKKVECQALGGGKFKITSTTGHSTVFRAPAAGRRSDVKRLPSKRTGSLNEEAEGLLSEITKISYSLASAECVDADSYPFLSPKRLEVANAGIEKTRA